MNRTKKEGINNDERRLRCRECGTKFKSLKEAEYYGNYCGNCRKCFQCDRCKTRFEYRSDLHTIYTTTRELYCEKCLPVAKQELDAQNRPPKKSDGFTKSELCPECGETREGKECYECEKFRCYYCDPYIGNRWSPLMDIRCELCRNTEERNMREQDRNQKPSRPDYEYERPGWVTEYYEREEKRRQAREDPASPGVNPMFDL